MVEGGVSELAVGLSKVEVLAPHHHSASLVCWFDNHVIAGSERAERFKLSHGQVGVFEWFAVQLADGGLAGSNIKIKGRETAAGWGPGGGLAGEGWQIRIIGGWGVGLAGTKVRHKAQATEVSVKLVVCVIAIGAVFQRDKGKTTSQ
jgi:hypothetical protein